MSTIENIENVVRSWVEAISGRETYIENQMGPTPENPYCTVHIQSAKYMPYDVKTYDFDNGQQTMRGQTLITFAISCWDGQDVLQVANRIRRSIEADARRFDIFSISGKGAVSDVQDLTAEYRGELQRRAEFNLSIYTVLNEIFDIECFERTNLTVGGDEAVTIGTDDPPPQQDQSGC